MENTIFSPRNYENVMPIAGSVKGKGLPTAPGEIFISHNDQTIASNSTRNHQNYNYEHVVTFKDKALPSVPREISISNNDQKIESNSTRNHQNYVVISPQQEENIIQQLRQELSKDIKNEVANQNAQLKKEIREQVLSE
ncbi:6907_t:CDS:1, partial [Funneliformis caledonium]